MSKGKVPQSMQPRSKTLESSQSEEISEDVEIIDLDSNADADVEIIDVDQPGTSRQTARFVKKERGNSPNYVISIDDDDDEQEENDEIGTGRHVRYGNSRNRYGLDVTSESESCTDDLSEEISDGESSDCEIIDDSGRIREEWEKANSKKRNSELNKVFGDAFDDNFGEKIGSFYSGGLDRDKAGPSCSVPKTGDANLDADNNGSNREGPIGPEFVQKDEFDIKKSDEFEKFNPSMFFEDELNNELGSMAGKEEAKECKFEKRFGMNSCSDTKGKGVASEEPSCLKEDVLLKKEKSESVEKTEMEVDESAKEEPCINACNGNEDPIMKNVAESMAEQEGDAPPVQTSDIQCELNEEATFGEDNDMVHGNEEGRNGEGDIIGDREKHKESEEYRRADEAEWASRQQQLRIQAEEVQRLKKRRKAESMRLLNMERRQKQRLDEIRQTQKKNEETMSLKEELRAKVRKDLEIIERRCTDMPSILRGLGIPVSGGLSPLPTEVKAAYKQALLRFHPDRVQTTDIHQLVKAEETFKFISRFKEKLLPVS